MSERVYTAFKRIGRDCLPLKWLVDDPTGYQVMRRVDNRTFVRYPNKPQLGTGDELDIEEALMDALMYLVMSALETTNRKQHMHNYYIEIEGYNNIQIESYMESATKDAMRFHQFP